MAGGPCLKESLPKPVAATLVVAASDSLHLERADYICDGVADEVEINLALAAMAAVNGGEVELLDGTFVLAAPIDFPGDKLDLAGQGAATLIDGDALLTNNHAIQIIGRIGSCTVKNMRIQTNGGGGLNCHCVFISDGSNGVHLEELHIPDSDANAIHIEGTTLQDIHINCCHMHDIDGDGIHVEMDANNHCYRLEVSDCVALNVGGTGINFVDPTGTGGNEYSMVSSNLVYQAGADGISVGAFDYSSIENNIVLDCTENGIDMLSATHAIVNDNVVWGNTLHGIYGSGSFYHSTVNDNDVSYNGSAGALAGIYVNGGIGLTISGNHVSYNQRYGMVIGASLVAGHVPNTITGNSIHDNYRDGIFAGGFWNIYEGNSIWHNSTEDIGVYHGITVNNNTFYASFIGNVIGQKDPPNPDRTQEDGIHVDDGPTHLVIQNNYCFNGLGSGICLAANNRECKISGNYCFENDDYGIEVLAGCLRTSINDNECIENGLHGITCDSADCQINDNYCYDNGQTSAETYHGINLAGNADRCQVNDNVCSDPGDSQEDGIHLVDGVIRCQIVGNRCYNGMGSGIALMANNIDCLIKDNYCENNDDYGIEIAAATCDRNIVGGNKLIGNGISQLLDAGTLTTVEEDNKDITPPQVKRYVYMKNTSGGALANGDTVVFKTGVAAGDEFTTTVVLGDDHVLGMMAEAIGNNSYGYVQVAGYTVALKGSNDNGNIAIGDFLCASNTAVECVKAGAGDMTFAIALEALAAAGPTALNALLINPMTF